MKRLLHTLSFALLFSVSCCHDAQADILSGLVHHWKMDESGSLETAFDSKGDNHASLANFQPGDPRWVPGRIGNGLRFSHHEQYALTQFGIPMNQYTVALWINRQSSSGVNPRLLAPLGEEWILIRDELNEGVGIGTVRSLIPPALGVWEHYAITFDVQNDQVTVYKNGFFSRSGSFDFDFQDPDPWMFAHNFNTNNGYDSFNGIFDDVRIYDRQLTPTDVLELFMFGSVAVDTFNIANGSYASGSAASLSFSDDSDLAVRRNAADIQARINIEFDGTSPTDNPLSFGIQFEASVFARSTIFQSLDLYDFVSSSWVQVDSRPASQNGDSIVTASATGDLSRFVEAGTGRVRARSRFNSSAQRQSFAAYVDNVIWLVGQ